MKCSEYLWKRLDLMNKLPDISPEQADGEMLIMMRNNGDTTITADDNGEEMSQREALSVLGRSYRAGGKSRLIDAYNNGQKSLFELLVTEQNLSDSEYQDAKKKAEEEAAQ